LWKYPTEGGIVSKPVAYEDNIFFGSEDHRLHVSARAPAKSCGRITQMESRSSPRIAEGHAFFGSDDKYLHAVNLN
jgi:eukaryotic-like serine/threonine-protein kinase